MSKYFFSGLFFAFTLTGFLSAAYGDDDDSLSLSPIYTGVATYFDKLGEPTGGCGIPQRMLETQNFVAMNVLHTPFDYTTHYPRPLTDWNKAGAWANGLNCGRWVRVTIHEACLEGDTSGRPGRQICHGGQWISDQFNGATQDYVVADSCTDMNTFCRDEWGHLDLSASSMDRLRPGLSSHKSNRKISWHFIDAPGYSGDIKIGFRHNACPYWTPIAINHLPRGIHGVEQQMNGVWSPLKMDSDMGQSYLLMQTPGNFYRIRIHDVYDQLLGGGRVYQISLPSDCLNGCKSDYTAVDYTISY